MTPSRYPQITDELLSAYIDDAVTKEEKTLIETAIVDEPAIAWRVETLRYTINLLSSLPAVALPRSFVLSELQATGQAGTRAAQSRRATAVAHQPTWRIHAGLQNLGESWRNFWQIGNLFLRNATAISLAVFLALVVSNEFVAKRPFPDANMHPQSASSATIAQSNQAGAEPQKLSPTAIAQASTARAVNSQRPTLAQPTTASQSVNGPATPAGSQAVGTVDAEAANTSAPSTTAAAASEISPPSAPQAAVVIAGAPNHQEEGSSQIKPPGPDEPQLGTELFVPAPPMNEPAMPASGALNRQLVTPKTAASGMQSVTNSPLMQQSALQTTVAPTGVTAPTPTITATARLGAYNAQRQAPVETTQIAPTLTPSATKPGPNSQNEGVQAATPPPVNNVRYQWSWLALAQVMSAFVTLILGALWWRSGEPHYRVRQQEK